MTTDARAIQGITGRLDSAARCAAHALGQSEPRTPIARLTRALGDLDRLVGDAAAAIVDAPHANHAELLESMRPAGHAVRYLRDSIATGYAGIRWRCSSIEQRLDALHRWATTAAAAGGAS